MRRFIIVIALALIAAACGAGQTSDTFESLDSASSDTMPPSDTTPTSAGAGAQTTTPDGPTTTLEPADAGAAPVTPAELPESDYPDVVVADLAGGEVNLRQLALEAEPVLLWFWAPH